MNGNEKQIAKEWRRLIQIAGSMGHGTLEITIVEGNPTVVKRAVQGIKLNEPEGEDEKKYDTIFL